MRRRDTSSVMCAPPALRPSAISTSSERHVQVCRLHVGLTPIRLARFRAGDYWPVALLRQRLPSLARPASLGPRVSARRKQPAARTHRAGPLVGCIVGAAIVAAVAGCGSGTGAPVKPSVTAPGRRSTPDAAQRRVTKAASQALTRFSGASGGSRLRFRDVQRAAAVYNAGASHPFVLFHTTDYDVTVFPSSGASILESPYGPTSFARPRDRRNWLASRSRVLLADPAAATLNLRQGTFGFIPLAGPRLTYGRVRRLPQRPQAFPAALRSYLGFVGAASPSASVLLLAYAYLLATAPLSAGTRSALYGAMAHLSGLEMCDPQRDLLGRLGVTVCAADGSFQTDVLLDPHLGTVLAVVQRVRRRLVAFGDLPAGSIIQSDAFDFWS